MSEGNNNKNNFNLKRCPFCGSEANIITRKRGLYLRHEAYCLNSDCGCRLKDYGTIEEAQAKWNREN